MIVRLELKLSFSDSQSASRALALIERLTSAKLEEKQEEELIDLLNRARYRGFDMSDEGIVR